LTTTRYQIEPVSGESVTPENNLPTKVISFVGSNREIFEIKGLLIMGQIEIWSFQSKEQISHYPVSGVKLHK
jgi:hypothetical protein